MNPFQDYSRGKTALVTGLTGFGGSWLSIWLTHLGANVIGYALEPSTQPSLFEAARLVERVTHRHGDVRDSAAVERGLRTGMPEIVFHLAAQPIVRLSYQQPRGYSTSKAAAELVELSV